MSQPSRKTYDRVLAAARHLFYWQGVRATSVYEITAGAGLSPSVMYGYFDSKEDLLSAYVDDVCLRYQEWFNSVTSREIGGPRERITALFGAIAKQIRTFGGRGCPLALLLSEYPDPNSLVHQRAIACKRWLRDQVGELTGELEDAAPSSASDLLADQLVLVIEGMYAGAQLYGPEGPPHQAGTIVDALLPRGPAS
ncbi:TetR/AcrR family transcriptional regulator [Nocardia brasiliensis]|uniref:TetR/AcrR family transcriptional regulator n=1 Tax=Nocardia brasiliensis TaxID=37326 RepID=UPI003D8F2A3D